MADFAERAGCAEQRTAWGSWSQTGDEVTVLVSVPSGTRGSDLSIEIAPRRLAVALKGTSILQGELFATIIEDESFWTLEDNGATVRVALTKALRGAEHAWKSLLKGAYDADAAVFDDMEKQLTLERFQRENPGFDFSGAELTGNYHGGGPQFPTRSA
eukprot:m.185531 g.185531  ORF g.185531 m.185531 type:complete len:158 (-) comp10519_c0_seq3:11737-12210(-)